MGGDDLSNYSLDSYSDNIVEEVSTDLNFYEKLSSIPSSFQGAVLFLGEIVNRPNNSTSYQFENIGGPNQEEFENLQTVSGSALVARTPVLSIILSGSRLSKEALTFTYEVEEGDSLSSIADDFGVSLETLLWENNLSLRTLLKVGDRLTVLPVDGVTHTIKRGDNITSIAQFYKTEANKILSYNYLSSSDIINIGDVLIIPDGRPHIPINPSITPSTPIHSLANISGYFGLPARGRITQGLHLYNAVDIGGNNYCNTPIYASSAGTIITSKTSGWNGGYGQYIKIAHPNSTVTLYAHNSQNLVSSGQQVSKGQTIALMGATGRTTGCHVHFEVRGARNPFTVY